MNNNIGKQKRWTNASLMLDRGLRRWANSNPALMNSVVFLRRVIRTQIQYFKDTKSVARIEMAKQHVMKASDQHIT